MKRCIVDYMMKTCDECIYFEFPKTAVYPLCRHPKKQIEGGITTDGFAFPEWCPFPDVKKK